METSTKSVAPKGTESPAVPSAPFSASSAYSFLAMATKKATDAKAPLRADRPDQD